MTTGVAMTTASSSGSARSSSKSLVVSRLWMAPRGLLEQVRGEVAEPAQVGKLVEVPGEVRAPVAEARLADA